MIIKKAKIFHGHAHRAVVAVKSHGVMYEMGEWGHIRHRKYVYEASALERSHGKSSLTIDPAIAAKEKLNDYLETRARQFMNKTSYFTDSGVIGSKAFVSENYQRFKHMFQCKHEKKPKPIKGIDGMYSLKRLSTYTL